MANQGVARTRLQEERKRWRKDRPYGFMARPVNAEDGSVNLLKWECGVPGKADTPWAGGFYRLTMTFDDEYPIKPPVCVFNPVLFHPNVFPTGHICLSLLYADQDWRSSLTVRDLLVGIQELLNDPNATHNAGPDAYKLYHADLAAYTARARAQAKANPPPDEL